MRLSPAALALALALSLPVAAHEAAPASVQFNSSKEAFRPWSIDTGWMPGTGAVQVRFIGFVGGGMSSTCGGAVHLGWPQSGLWAEGGAGAGQLSMDLGVELQTYLRLDLQIPGGPRVTWEGPIPMFPGFDYRFANAASFTPFLLYGQQPASVAVSDEIQQTELYSLSLTDLIIPIPGLEGNIEVSAGGLLDLAMRGARLSFPEGDLVRDGQVLPVTIQPGPQYQTSARYDADVTYQGSLLLEPAVVIHVGPFEWDLARFDLPVPLPPVSETWSFNAQAASFTLPRLQAQVVENSQALSNGATVDFAAASARTVRLTNPGQTTLSGTATVSGAGFSLDVSGAVSLPPGGSADLPLRFQGTSGTGALVIDTDDPAGPMALTLQASTQSQEPPPGPDAGAPDAGAPDAGAPDGGEPPPDDVIPPECGCTGAGGALPFAVLAALAAVATRRSRGRIS